MGALEILFSIIMMIIIIVKPTGFVVVALHTVAHASARGTGALGEVRALSQSLAPLARGLEGEALALVRVVARFARALKSRRGTLGVRHAFDVD